MKLRTALPILLASASILLSGIGLSLLGHANAQDADPRPGAPGPAGASKIQPFRSGLEGTPAARAVPAGARVSFNLEDADLPDLVRLVSRMTGKRFILPSKARSIKATIYSPTDVTAGEAYQAFLSILSMNGLTLEPSGRYYKIIEASGIEGHILPMYRDGEVTPADDRFVTRIHRLSNVSAEDVSQLLTRFKSAEGAVSAYAPTNILIITDTGANVRRMLRIVSEIDVPRTGEQVWIEPVHHASATDLAARLLEIFPAEGAGGAAAGTKARPAAARPPVTQEGQPAGAASQTVGGPRAGEARVTNILADERTNSLVIVATERAYLRVLELIRALDIEIDGGGGQVHVHPLQYADAETLATTLSSLSRGGGGAGGAPGAPPGGAPGGAASSGNAQVNIQAHKATNSLVITASNQSYASLRRVIEQLDVAPRQVFIEAVIMELQVQRSSKLGISYHGGLPEPNVDGNQSLSILGFGAATSLGFPVSAVSNPDLLSGLAVGVRGPNLPTIPGIGLSLPSFGAVLNALSGSSDADVLSTPHLIAMDNIEAEINVGANVPLQRNAIGLGTGTSALGGLAGAAGGAAGAQGLGALGALGGLGGLGGGFGGGSVPRQNVGTKIKITPHINDSGEIRLEIDEEISEAGAPDASSNVGTVTIQQRTAKTQVLVRDQQTVVIGGLMRDRLSASETKVPILGDIPIIGALFRTQNRTTEKTNLLLFLTPYIVRGPEDLRSVFERRMRERQEFVDRFFVFGDHEYRPPLDYSRTRGLLHEMFNELNDLEAEARIAEELRLRPPPEHVARPPIGAENASDGEMEEGDVVIEPDGESRVVAPAPVSQGQPSAGSEEQPNG